MRLDRSNDMPVNDSNVVTPVLWKLWHVITKMSNSFLEHQIVIKFCVKLGKNASDTYAVLLRIVGEKLWKS